MNEQKQVNTYNPAEIQKKPGKPGKRGKGGNGWKKGLIIFLILVLVIVGAGVSCNMGVKRALGTSESSYNFDSDYIGVLEIHGTMSDSGDSNSTYNQGWLIERIEQMKKDPLNKGMILSVNTPGGSVYAIDELYLKIKEYEEVTGRPVYTYMESMAASGGYYISAGTEKIYANRNCWTGSIGVTIGTIYDFSGFLEKMGVKTVTITAGENKAMGGSTEPLTKEQKAIFQGLVDEAYEQFVGIVSEGRDMKLSEVKKLADGRIYTAKQAKDNGLIDEIGSLEDTVRDMKKSYELENCKVQTLSYEPKSTLYSLLNGMTDGKEGKAKTEYEQMMELLEENNTFTITYMSQVKK